MVNIFILLSQTLLNDISCVTQGSQHARTVIYSNMAKCFARKSLLSVHKGAPNNFMIAKNELDTFAIDGKGDLPPTFNITDKVNKYFAVTSYDSVIKKELLKKDFSFINSEITTSSVSAKEFRDAIAFLRNIIAFFKICSLEYGPKVFEYLDDVHVANSSQWWSHMVINKFATASVTHAERLLHITKTSKGPSQANGASALFPTNITFGNLIFGLRNKGSHVTKNSNMIASVIENDTLSKIMSKDMHIFVQFAYKVAKIHGLHLGLISAYQLDRFMDFETGYMNVWRYTNSSFINNPKLK